jgi:hypothetical protein
VVLLVVVIGKLKGSMQMAEEDSDGCKNTS